MKDAQCSSAVCVFFFSLKIRIWKEIWFFLQHFSKAEILKTHLLCLSFDFP